MEYHIKKNQLREFAMDWQNDFENHNYSWSELAYWGDYFYKMGKKYGLLKEFRENGVI